MPDHTETDLGDPQLASTANSILPEPTKSAPLPEFPADSPISINFERVRAQTPARILTGPASTAYRTATYLDLRRDHAAAKDAVNAEFNLTADFGSDFVARWNLFEIGTLARTKEQFLLNPELGRSLDPQCRDELLARCPTGADIQVVIADGLTAAAVRVQVPPLLPQLAAETARRAWRFGQPFFVRHGRVGLMNDVGAILGPKVVILLIGERPGLATAESLSAYMSYHPRQGDDDSRRNLISNIHSRGIPADQAAVRIARLADLMIQLSSSGVAVKEQGLGEQILAPPPTSLVVRQT
jgi:ethanolamine ammonia-lyase small subunit